MNELFWIGPALIAGLLAVRVGLPPMVGYLVCGFVLNGFGVNKYGDLSDIGNLGVTLLLFTIGLKLDVRSLLKPVVWAGASLHMLAIVFLFGLVVWAMSFSAIALFDGVNLVIAALIAFALSFSSTVFAVKTLEDRGELQSRHGQIAIGILIMQDIFAVVFLAFSTGEIPTIWALSLLLLIPLHKALLHLMTRAGHGELMILFGLAMTFGVSGWFDMVGVKGDLGALIIGAVLAAHPAAAEMSKKLMGFKDLLLVGFFLSIGMSGDITVAAVAMAAVLALAVILKVALYFFFFIRFQLRARTSVFASFNLANYSEFGLIVGSIALANGWLSADWLVTIAIALTMTFIAAAPLNARANDIYDKHRDSLARFQSPEPLPEDEPFDPGDARIVIAGMKRLGTGVYDTLHQTYGDILGIEPDQKVVDYHSAAGRNVRLADPTDDDFWSGVGKGKVEVVVLTMQSHEQNLGIAQRIRKRRPDDGYTVSVAYHQDQMDALKEAGTNVVWNLETEAGTGLADHIIDHLGSNLKIDGK